MHGKLFNNTLLSSCICTCIVSMDREYKLILSMSILYTLALSVDDIEKIKSKSRILNDSKHLKGTRTAY
jgi:hypothetical protein